MKKIEFKKKTKHQNCVKFRKNIWNLTKIVQVLQKLWKIGINIENFFEKLKKNLRFYKEKLKFWNICENVAKNHVTVVLIVQFSMKIVWKQRKSGQKIIKSQSNFNNMFEKS